MNESGCKYNRITLPVETNIVVEFPFKCKISIFVGMIKIYPAIEKYIKKHNINDKGALVERYDIPNKKTIYRMVVKK